MNKDILDYSEFIDKAVKGAIKYALKKAEKTKFGNYCFVLSVNTQAKGVKIPSHVRKQNPERLFLVLEYDFDNLKVRNNNFSVDLKFDGKMESITIPFDAVCSFSDQVAGIELRFNSIDLDDDYFFEDDEYEYEDEEREDYGDNLIKFSDIKRSK